MKDEEITQLINEESFLNYCFQRNEEDVRYWEDWLAQHPEHTAQIADLKQQLLLMGEAAAGWVKQQHFTELQHKIAAGRRHHAIRRYWPRIAAAASVVLLLSAGGYFLWHRQQPARPPAQNLVQDIQPGSDKAVLTLAGGRQVDLTGAANGTIARQGSMVVHKTADGKIVYDAAANPPGNNGQPAMNTITTPRGGKWSATLSDGTKVWLNAASSITYPVAFAGKERKVSITGEAYFEVVHNAARPFKVMANGQTIDDIGTAFNINAYTDEPETKTTLVEGSVKVSNAWGTAVLQPGQQAKAASTGKAGYIQVGYDKDMAKTLAWKNDLFIFNRTDLHTLMRELARWYDVEVVYEAGVKNDIFFGRIKRDNNLSQILKVLELGDVHFRIEGRKLIVQP